MLLKETTFAQLLEFLGHRFHLVPLNVLLGNESKDSDDSRPRCLLTFDDGWRDNYTTALPWLKKFAIPATIFMTTGAAGSQGGFWVEQIARSWKDPEKRRQIQLRFPQAAPARQQAPGLEEVVEHCKRMSAGARENFLHDHVLSGESSGGSYPADQMLSWDEVVEMNRHGIDFGSHTVSHPLLSYEDGATVERELSASKQALQEKLGKEVVALAYPNGDWNERVRQKVKHAGYRLAFTTERRWYSEKDDPLSIPRIMLHEGSVAGLDGKFSPAVLSLRLFGWHEKKRG